MADRRTFRTRISHRKRPSIESLESRLLLCALDHLNQLNTTLWAKVKPQPALATARAIPQPQPTVRAAPVDAAPSSDVPPVTAADSLTNGMPVLNSLPNAPSAIYLDFDGDTTTNTTAYSEDADGTTFNATEAANITEAWRHIAAYFAMFDVNVTTVLPSVPKAWHATGNNISGGYAYVGTFPATYPRGFNQSSDARSRQSGIAHEVGHMMGLAHQSTFDHWGTRTAEYAGAPDPLHGPLMGVDYAGNVHKWIIGHPTSSAASLQDDMAVMANKFKVYQAAGGDGYRADDYGNTLSTATPLAAPVNGAQTVTGIIERLTDIDSFSFTTAGGNYSIAAIPDMPSGADLRIELYNSAGTLIAASDDANNAQQISLTLAADTYTILVACHGNYGDQGAYELGVRTLPDFFATTDFSTAARWGTTTYDAATGVITNAGSGSDVWGTSDGFHFAYQPIVGNTTLTVRVTSIQNTAAWAKSGLEIREQLTANSKHVGMIASYSNSPQFLWRSSTGGSTSSVNGTAGVAFSPIWLRLVRTGNSFTASKSSDGIAWTTVGTQTVSMNSTVYVGLLTSALNNSKLNTSTFESLTITGNAPAAPIYNALPAPANLMVAQAATGTGLVLTWDAVTDSTGYSVHRSVDGINWSNVGTTAAGVTTYTDSSLTSTKRYFYRVTATDASGNSIPSSTAFALNRPVKVPSLSVTALSTSQLVLNWKDTDYETGYRIERSSDGGATYTTLTTVGANVPSYNNTGLATATSYTYRVTPLSDTGDGVATTVTDSTRLPTTTGQAFDSVASTAITFHWTAVSGATGYRIERSTDGSTFSTLANVTTTTHTDSTVSALSEYYYRVIATAGSNLGVFPSAIFTATPPTSTALPAPWATTDIGSVGGAGAASISGSTYTLIGSGSDIWGTADAMRFLYQPLVGDGEIIARVATQEDTDGWAKAGVMVRASLAAGATNTFMAISPDNGVTWQRRTSTNGSTSSTATAGFAAPYWVKLTRVGNVFTGSYSADGVTWTTAGTQSITMSGTVYMGLANTAHNNTRLNKSTFSNVTVSNAAPTVATAAAASPSSVTGTTATLSVLGADDHGEPNLAYTWAATTVPAGASAPTFSANGTNAAKSSIATFSAPGSYQFTVTIADSSGLLVTSSVNLTVNSTPTTITLAPSPAWVATSDSVQLSATVLNQFGQTISSPAITWSVTTGGGSINSSGVFSSPSTVQTSTVRAVSGSAQSTVTINTVTPPAVTSTSFQIVTWPAVLSFTFDRDVAASLTPDDVVITNLATSLTYTPASFSYDLPSQAARFFVPADLPNGNYQAMLAAGKAADSHNIATRSASSLDFFALAGDTNRDRSVDFGDLTALAAAYGTTSANWAQGDFNGDGTVNFFDLTTLSAAYGSTLPAPSEPLVFASSFTPATTTQTSSIATTSSLFSTTNIAPKKVNRPIRRRF